MIINWFTLDHELIYLHDHELDYPDYELDYPEHELDYPDHELDYRLRS